MDTNQQEFVSLFSPRGPLYSTEAPESGPIDPCHRYTGSGRRVYLVDYWIDNPMLISKRFRNGQLKKVTEYQKLVFNQLGHEALTSTVYKSLNAYSKLSQRFNRVN